MKAVNPVMTQWYLDANGIEEGEADLLAKKDRVYILSFEPTDEPTPPPLEADLLWLWTAIGMLLVLLRRGGKRRN
jgi:hypothetical protein